MIIINKYTLKVNSQKNLLAKLFLLIFFKKRNGMEKIEQEGQREMVGKRRWGKRKKGKVSNVSTLSFSYYRPVCRFLHSNILKCSINSFETLLLPILAVET